MSPQDIHRRRGGPVESPLDDLPEKPFVVTHPRHLQRNQRWILLEHEVVLVHGVAFLQPSGDDECEQMFEVGDEASVRSPGFELLDGRLVLFVEDCVRAAEQRLFLR